MGGIVLEAARAWFESPSPLRFPVGWVEVTEGERLEASVVEGGPEREAVKAGMAFEHGLRRERTLRLVLTREWAVAHFPPDGVRLNPDLGWRADGLPWDAPGRVLEVVLSESGPAAWVDSVGKRRLWRSLVWSGWEEFSCLGETHRVFWKRGRIRFGHAFEELALLAKLGEEGCAREWKAWSAEKRRLRRLVREGEPPEPEDRWARAAVGILRLALREAGLEGDVGYEMGFLRVRCEAAAIVRDGLEEMVAPGVLRIPARRWVESWKKGRKKGGLVLCEGTELEGAGVLDGGAVARPVRFRSFWALRPEGRSGDESRRKAPWWLDLARRVGGGRGACP